MRARTARHYLTALAAVLAIAMLLSGCARGRLNGCAGGRRVTLYKPGADGALTAFSARAEEGAEGLIAALTREGVLPEAESGYLYCALSTEEAAPGEAAHKVVRLDISDALGKALGAMEDERPAVQALVNTFLTEYDAEALALSVEGVNLQTLRANYDHEISFDEYAKTR